MLRICHNRYIININIYVINIMINNYISQNMNVYITAQ